MKKSFRVSIVLSLVISLTPATATAVYNGMPALGDERVVLVVGGPQWRISCSGSLIAPRLVYTAAHCADAGANYVWPPNATVGENNSFAPVKVIKQIIPKEFNNNCVNCGRGPIQDFMILVLESDLADVKPMRIATISEVSQLIQNQTDVIQIGYGVKQWAPNNSVGPTNYPERLVSKLRATSFLQSNQEEKDLLASKPNIFINTINSPDKTMCGGDSGSPLYFKDGKDYVFIGPLSSVTGISCQYSKNDSMRSNAYWIERTLGVYYVAAYYQESINEAEKFLKAKIQEEAEAKAAAELKAKQEAEERATAEAKAAAELKAKQEAEERAADEVKAKAAADLKAKQDAEAKVAADKIAAEQLAASKAAALKKTTITCIKGKLTKKVTAVKPKCPTGYTKR